MAFVNPYLIAYLKNVWTFSESGEAKSTLTSRDYEKLTFSEELAPEYLKKILQSDNSIRSSKETTLDNLCRVVSEHIKGFPSTWKSLIETQNSYKIYRECQKLDKNIPLNISFSKSILNARMHKEATFNAIEFYASKNSNISRIASNLPTNILGLTSDVIHLADIDDIVKIYDFAIQDNPYEDCPVNGPELKSIWWKKNNLIFYVIKNKEGDICANMNLLPITESCYRKIKEGLIEECDINENDILPIEDRNISSYIYVEGLNCSNFTQVKEFHSNFRFIIDNVASVRNTELVICAIGGTRSGDNLMKKLNFKVSVKGSSRMDGYDFYEVEYKDLPIELRDPSAFYRR